VTDPQPNAGTTETSDIREYLRPILSRWPLILVIVAIVATAAYYQANKEPKRYRASTTILLSNSSGIESILFGAPSFGDPERFARNQAALLTSRSFAARVAERLKFRGNPAALISGLAITPATDSDFLYISSTTGNPVISARIANAYAAEFVELRKTSLVNQARTARRTAERQLQGGNLSEAQAEEVQQKINRLELVEAFPQSNAEQLDKALPPAASATASPRQQAIFAGAIALVCAIALCFGLEALDRRLRRREDVEGHYGLPVLAEVPRVRNPSPTQDGAAVVPKDIKESFRSLRTNLQLGELTGHPGNEGALRKLLVTSAITGEGKSMLVRNLAITYREAGLEVAVIDADLRAPDVARLFEVEGRNGLLDVLTGSETLGDALQSAELRTDGLDTIRLLRRAESGVFPGNGNGNGNGYHDETARVSLLTSASPPADPATVLASDRFRVLLDEIADMHDVVLIDSAPVLPVSDTVPLLSLADGVILVARLGHTTRGAARRAVDTVRRSPGARLLGVVVNDTHHGEPQHGYEYYHYGFEQTEPQQSSGRKLLRR
jgi:Mrp family chromosome partitioning ATPase